MGAAPPSPTALSLVGTELGAGAPTPGVAAEAASAVADGSAPPAAASATMVPAMSSPRPKATTTPWSSTATPTPPVRHTYLAREKVKFDVSPDSAHVIINGRDIGEADDWDDRGGGRKWEFPRVPGVYWVHLQRRHYKSMWVKIIADSEAKDKTAEVEVELEKLDDD